MTPVSRKLLGGKHGRLILGGNKYKKELKGMSKALRVIKEYEKKGKIVRVDDTAVDDFARKAKAKVKSKNVQRRASSRDCYPVSRCQLFCSVDKEAMPFLTSRILYNGANMKPPKIFSQKAHKTLCCPTRIAEVCLS